MLSAFRAGRWWRFTYPEACAIIKVAEARRDSPEGTVWAEIRVARDLLVAEAWREVFENQGIPCKIWPMDSRSHGVALTAYQVLVPNDRLHVADLVVSHTF